MTLNLRKATQAQAMFVVGVKCTVMQAKQKQPEHGTGIHTTKM